MLRKKKKKNSMPDYYEELCISRAAQPEDVSKAYRMASLKYHPDNNTQLSGDKAKEYTHKFRFVAEAYEVLSNPKLRAVFDMYGEAGLTQMGYKFSGDAKKVFETFFGVDSPFQLLGSYKYFTKTGGNAKPAVTIPPLEIEVVVSFEDVYLGCTKHISYTTVHFDQNGRKTATTKDSVLEFVVARGMPVGSSVTFVGKGHSRDGAPAPGDVVCKLLAQPHSRFTLQNSNLVYEKKITLSEALSGLSMSVKTLDDRSLEVCIEEVVHPSYIRVLEGEGMPFFDEKGGAKSVTYGNLIITFKVEYPKYLSANQKVELARILSASE